MGPKLSIFVRSLAHPSRPISASHVRSITESFEAQHRFWRCWLSLMRDDRIRSVAIFRALKLGDMLCATPALRAMRRHWSNAHIALIALPWFREMADRYAHLIDEIIDFPGYPDLPEQASTPEAAAEFIKAMQGRRFDLVVQMHGSGEVTNPLVG